MTEGVGKPGTFAPPCEEVAFTGRVVYIGYAKETVRSETRLFVQKELDVPRLKKCATGGLPRCRFILARECQVSGRSGGKPDCAA